MKTVLPCFIRYKWNSELFQKMLDTACKGVLELGEK